MYVISTTYCKGLSKKKKITHQLQNLTFCLFYLQRDRKYSYNVCNDRFWNSQMTNKKNTFEYQPLFEYLQKLVHVSYLIYLI